MSHPNLKIPLSEIGVNDIMLQFWAALRPRKLFPIDQWADTRRILPASGSSKPGQWRTSRNPPVREIMQVLSHNHPCRQVAVVSPTQWGKTEILLNFIFSNMDQRPGPTLCVQPTINDVRKFVRQRFDASLEYMPKLRNMIGSTDGKGGDSTMIKMIPNGAIMFGWSNSSSNLASMPIKYLGLDEIDKYAFDADGQGCPIEQAIQRVENFPDHKVLYVSSPGNMIDSRIWPRFLEGDQRIFLVPCWHCNHMFFMDWPQMEWEKDNRGRVIEESCRVKCPACEYLNEESHKTSALEEGFWEPQNDAGEYPSFRINALYKPLGWGSWFQTVKDYRKSKRTGIHAYKVWYNTKRALPWEEEGTKAEPTSLMSRREVYNHDVPDGVKIITAGVDVQDDRLEAEAVGWGPGFENWAIEKIVLWGDTSQNRVWMDLDTWLWSSWERGDGTRQHIAATCIDSLGHRTEEVYLFCKPRESRRIFPCYGKGGDGLPILGRVTRRHKSGVYLFPIGADTAKDVLLAQLLTQQPGPNYCHFPKSPEYDAEHFKQLTAETKVRKLIAGRMVMKWEKTRDRNEAIDIRQLSRAALEITSVDLDEMTTYLAQPTELTPRKTRKTRRSGVKL